MKKNEQNNLSDFENSAATINMYAIRENDLNPLLTVSDSGRVLFSLVYRPLVSVGQNFDFSCILAESVTPSSDCSVFSVRLRDDVSWHDGTPVTSTDVDYTISKIMGYSDDSPYYENLKNVKDCYKDGVNGYIFALEKSDSGFPALLNFPIIKNGSLGNKPSIVGTGEFFIKEYKDYTSLLLESKSGQRINVTLLFFIFL